MVDLDNFPELLDEEIEKKAQELIESYQNDSDYDLVQNMPIPVESIAEQHLGYDIEITTDGLFEDPDYLGGIHFKDKLIQINGSIENHDGRYSFTVAHELGHHCLHKDALLEMNTDDENMCREATTKPIAEAQADKFAAYLLMPSGLVLDAFHRSFGNNNKPFNMDYNNKYKLGTIAQRVIESGGFSNVSLTAMTNRLIGMKLITGVSYQKYVMPDFSPKTIKGLWKYYISMINKGVKRLLKTDD
jgi:Zn-dependent peptidase ImmA (M78 family)